MLAVLAGFLLQSDFLFLDRAHSHNDYTRAKPLIEALENGFASVEVDVFLVDGKLLVGHNKSDLNPEKTIESMYMKPIEARLKENGGWVYPRIEKTFWVLVDIKENGSAVYEAFKKTLTQFPLLKYDPAKVSVRFVISGDRPVDAIVQDKGAYAGLDGRWADMDKGYSAEMMPWVSEDWNTHFKWRSIGGFPRLQADKLTDMVLKVRSQKRKSRFWGAPDTIASWDAQWRAGVDLINTDYPAAMKAWVIARRG